MATIRQHIPAFFEGMPQSVIEFDTQEELLDIPFVRAFRVTEGAEDTPDPYFYRYSIAEGDKLMVEIRGGKAWFVIGHLDDISNLNLPDWKPNA